MILPWIPLVAWLGVSPGAGNALVPGAEPPRTVAHHAEVEVSPAQRWVRRFSWARDPYVRGGVRLDVDDRGRFVVSGARGVPTSRPETLRSSEYPPSSVSIDARRSLSTIPSIDLDPGAVRWVPHMLAHSNATVVVIRYVSSTHPHHGERWRHVALHLGTDGAWVSTEFRHLGPGVLLDDGTIIVTPRRGETIAGTGVRVRGPVRISPRGVLTRFPIRFHAMAAFGDQVWGVQRRGFRDHLLNTSGQGTELARITLPRRWRASTPMPTAAGPCVVLSRGDSRRLACFDPTGATRYDLAIPEDSTCLHDAAGRMYLGSPGQARITALDSEGRQSWQLSVPLASNFAATEHGELCWIESAETAPQLTCLGPSKTLAQPSTRSVRANASPTEAR